MWRSMLLYFCMCVFVYAQSDERESKVVNTTQGAVRGYKDPKYGLYSFHSIPYATAPTGPHRFKQEVSKTVKEFYFGDKPVGEDNILGYVDYFSDVIFTYSTLRSLKLMVENGHDQSYLYEYSFVDEFTPVVPHTNVNGANHCAESIAVAGELMESEQTNEFKKLSSTMRQLWANFIKTGKPVPEGSSLPAWPAVEGDWAPHMSLASPLHLRGSLLEQRARFWENIYAKHYRNPLPPPAPPSYSKQ